jgi:ubiquinone/menaquinone biosynthesis C-methylase UbiE
MSLHQPEQTRQSKSDDHDRTGGAAAHAESARTFVPAAGRDWALPLYDPLVTLLGANPTRRALIDQAFVRTGHRVLEIGCGTGSLTVLIARVHPESEVIGLDPDPKALARARRKAERAGVSIQFNRAFSDAMPYPTASLDHVFSSFMFHHLPGNVKEGTLREVRRVLKPGGFLHLVDFTGHRTRMEGSGGDRIVSLMGDAGLTNARKVRDDAVLFGRLRISYYQASRPARAD